MSGNVALVDGAASAGLENADRSLFRGNELLADIPDEAFERFIREVELVVYEPGDVIFHEDEMGDCMYLIASGSVKISKKGRAGQQETLAHLAERDFFGEMALVDAGRRSAQAMAESACLLGRVDHQAWGLLFRIASAEVLGSFTRTITKRLRHNNQHFIEEMMRNERLSLLGSTVSSIMHDMNNPLASILAACELLEATRPDDALVARASTIVREAVQRMQAMTRELVEFSGGRSTRVDLRPTPLAKLVASLEHDFRRCRERQIEVQTEVPSEESVVMDLQRMLRVFSNLVRNARDAMEKSTTRCLYFRARREHDDAIFEVTDTGCGMPREILPRIFDPFMTHGKAHGTGLGLAIAKGIVEAHGGRIAVRSVEGSGTTFTITLPGNSAAST